MSLRPSAVSRNTVALTKLAYLDDREENRAELERTLLHSLPLNSKNRKTEPASLLRKVVNTLGGAAGIYGLYKGIREGDFGKAGLSALGLGALGVGNLLSDNIVADYRMYDPEYAAAQKKLDELENDPEKKDYYLDIFSTLDKYDNPEIIQQSILLKDKQLSRQPYTTTRTKTSEAPVTPDTSAGGVSEALKNVLGAIDYKKLGLIAGGGLTLYGGAKLFKHLTNDRSSGYVKYPTYDRERASINRALRTLERDNPSSYNDIIRQIARFDYESPSAAETAAVEKKSLQEQANKLKELAEYRQSELGKSVGESSDLRKELDRVTLDKSRYESDLVKSKKDLEDLVAAQKERDAIFKRRALMALGAATIAGTAGGYAYARHRRSKRERGDNK